MFKTSEETKEAVSKIKKIDIIYDDYEILKYFDLQKINGAKIVSIRSRITLDGTLEGINKFVKFIYSVYSVSIHVFDSYREKYFPKNKSL